MTTGKLSESARHVVLPAEIVSTGWPAVRDTCAGFGVRFDPWQDGAGRAILAKRADGRFACSVGGAVLSIPRQVGKTFLIGAIVFALCMIHPGLTVIWTAHRARTADETFGAMQAFAKRKKVKPHVAQVLRGAGDQAVVFHNGSRVLFGARERGFGLGFAKVGVLVLDEAQRLTDTAIDDMVPTTNQADAPFPLVFLMGTPPRPADPGEVFARKRNDALSGDDPDTLYIEFSADEGAHPTDREQWRKANVSYPMRTPESAMLRMKKNLTPESFLREALGIWDRTAGSIPGWSTLHDPDSIIVANQTWAVAQSPVDAADVWTAVAKAGRNADGRIHVETIKHDVGTNWAVPLIVELWGKRQIPIRVGPGPERAFVAALIEAGVEVIEVSAVEVASSTTAIINAARSEPPGLAHIGQRSLAMSVANARLDRMSTGAVQWTRKKTDLDITPLLACTVALGGVPQETGPTWLFA